MITTEGIQRLIAGNSNAGAIVYEIGNAQQNPLVRQEEVQVWTIRGSVLAMIDISSKKPIVEVLLRATPHLDGVVLVLVRGEGGDTLMLATEC